jgi:hypothetical protein
MTPQCSADRYVRKSGSRDAYDDPSAGQRTGVSLPDRVRHAKELRIPSDADQRSELMSISIPK